MWGRRAGAGAALTCSNAWVAVTPPRVGPGGGGRRERPVGRAVGAVGVPVRPVPSGRGCRSVPFRPAGSAAGSAGAPEGPGAAASVVKDRGAGRGPVGGVVTASPDRVGERSRPRRRRSGVVRS